MIKLVIAVTFLLYIGMASIHHLLDSACLGPECEALFCPDGYAMKIDGVYVPCDEIGDSDE